MGKRILHVTGFGRDTPFDFDGRDAADAFDRMHDQYVGDSRIAVQWAKRPPARSWRFDAGDDDRARVSRRSRSRSRSPSYRGSRSGRRRSSRSPPRDRRPYDDRRPSPPRNARRRDESAERVPRDRSPPSPRDRSPPRRPRSPRSSYSHSRSRSPARDASPNGRQPMMDVDALLPADEPAGANEDEPRRHDDDIED
ncbi:hypothetical protein GGI20_002650 [Coemansia sp. BCRC 34301]|nr:hypothetical protein GGI20_002650 [Coemansia sp. BCRC 34301]